MERKTLLIAAIAAAFGTSAASLGSLAWVYGRVRAYERENGVNILSAHGEKCRVAPVRLAEPPKPSDPPKTSESPKPSEPSVSAAETAELKVVGVKYDKNTRLEVSLSARPEMSGIRQYVSVSPLNDGFVSIAYNAKYSYARKVYVPTLVVTGDFANRTNVTLRIRRGLALHGNGEVLDSKGALAEDYTYTFRRDDLKPYVKFASVGRYLPPCGRRQVVVESVNHASVQAEIRRVQPRNIVQLLAREEREYKCYYGGGGDSEDTIELSGEPMRAKAPCANEPNKKESWRLPVAMNDGGSPNGVFLVGVGGGEVPFCDDPYRYIDGRWQSEGDWYNPPTWRLVCVSDIGLSVRSVFGGSELGVWATSLTRGVPMAGAIVEVYSKSNVKVMEGVADECGWCLPKRVGDGEPFAVVAYTAAADDMTFMALSDRMQVDETLGDGLRPEYLKSDACTGFAWTDRGIYRHEEKIMFHLLVRNGRMKAPKPFPVELRLVSPKGDLLARRTVMPDALGSVVCDAFAVPADQPSGKWKICAAVPGSKDDGGVYSSVEVKVEEFAPPQIRVKVAASASVHPTNFAFEVSAEHLFGGPAGALRCEGAVVFEDAPFAPDGWKGYFFGNEDLGLKPSYRELSWQELDADGKTTFAAPIWAESGRPRAMVRAVGQGVVFEDGGRPATARGGALLHYYPYYIGSTLDKWLRRPQSGPPKIRLACVGRDGRRLADARSLEVRIERIDSVYSYRQTEHGWNTWDCEHIRSVVAEGIRVKTSADADTELPLPLEGCGDYAISVADPETGVSFARTFYLSEWGDDAIRAPLANPTEVGIGADRPYYRAGERPRLVVKSPFAGYALLSVMREGMRYSQVLQLTNATSEVELAAVGREDAPNLDVCISVVQGVEANARHFASRAHGQTTVRVRPAENEIPVRVRAKVDIAGVGSAADAASTVAVDVEAPRAESAVVTLVDEGINILTGEAVPDPIGWFAQPRAAGHPLYDIYGMILPVVDEALKANGVKTGGGFGAELLGRVSPVGSRRFKPLSMWRANVPVRDGRARAVFSLPEFAGEVRVTAVAYSASAVGANAVCCKVAPKLVMQPDAPRFVAPGDVFEATLPLKNTSSGVGEVEYAVAASGVAAGTAPVSGRVTLRPRESTNVVVKLSAPASIGQLALVYRADGLGESHAKTIELPVRPAVAWRETAGVCPESQWRPPQDGKWSAKTFDSPIGEYEAALRWLADYPHGCLEQTSSRIYPLVAAGGALSGVVSNADEYVAAGVRRVESMIRENDFVMWPDCSVVPWTREVSIYAAEFLVAANSGGVKMNQAACAQVAKFLKRWARDGSTNVSVYASLVLAQFGAPDRDRMFALYDNRAKLTALSRARLSLAFSLIDDRRRAAALMAESFEPQTVKEASFALRARLAVNPEDERILPLVSWLNARRDREKHSWGTTEDNAHALVAIGACFKAHPPKKGERFVAWRRLALPNPADVRDEAEGIFVDRRFFRADGAPADMQNLRCGELLVAQISITSAVTRVVNDLVVEDLFAGCLEPVHRDIPQLAAQPSDKVHADWVMRRDARDDRMLVFSKRFTLEAGHEARFAYPVRVVSAGEYVLPGTSVEGMYDPRLHARRAPVRAVVRH